MLKPTLVDTMPKIRIYEVSDFVNSTVFKILERPEVYHYDDVIDVWSKDFEELDLLYKSLLECVKDYVEAEHWPSSEITKMDGWCVTFAGSNTHLSKHHHADHADVVAVYYAENDNIPGQGDIQLFDEDDNLVLQLSPRPKTLLLFPGDWDHLVTPYDGLRLSIATNIILKNGRVETEARSLSQTN